jgi:hypothetical protein
MKAADSPKAHNIRRDGWTPERQLLFINALTRTRSVTRAAASVGMSRESAHRFRKRDNGGLFTLLWRVALAPKPQPPSPRELYESHIATIRRGCGAEGKNFRLPAKLGQIRDFRRTSD